MDDEMLDTEFYYKFSLKELMQIRAIVEKSKETCPDVGKAIETHNKILAKLNETIE